MDFKQLLIDSIPFEAGDSFFIQARQNVDTIVATGVTTVEEMLNILGDARFDTELRREVNHFCTWLHYKPAIQPLIQVATSEVEDVDLRRSAMVCLAILDRRKAFPVLKHICTYNPDPAIRECAITAFYVMPSKRVFNAVIQVITQEKNPDVKGLAIRAISFIPQSDEELAFELFLSLFGDSAENPSVRAYAMEGLGYLQDERALDMVIQNLTNEFPQIRYMSAFSLGSLGNTTHIPLLEPMSTDDAVFETWGTVAEAASEAIAVLLRKASCPL